MNTNLDKQIIDILTPYLGKTMSEASLKVNCTTYLHVPPEKMTREQIPALCNRLAKGLQVFVGSEKTGLVINTIMDLK